MRPVSLLVTFLLLFVAGCRPGQELPLGGKPAPKLYLRVVSLSPSATDLAETLYTQQVVGRTASCTRAQQAPIVMSGVKPDYEFIATLKPDVVVYDPDLFSESDLAKFKELNIQTFAFGGDTVDEFCKTLSEYARFTIAADKASEYVDKMQRERETAQATLPTPPVKAVMVIPGSGAEHMIHGQGGFIGDVLKAGGAIPIGPEGKIFVPLNAEWLIQQNPDLIITAGVPDAFLNDPRFKSLDAVKKKHVYGTNADITLRRGYNVDRFIKRVNDLVNMVRH